MNKLTANDINALVGTINSGYTIERARVKGGKFSDSDCYGIVLGKNKVGMYVTWQFHFVDGNPDYYWGHYFEDKEPAVADYEVRS
jgi:hypothetical protein